MLAIQTPILGFKWTEMIVLDFQDFNQVWKDRSQHTLHRTQQKGAGMEKLGFAGQTAQKGPYSQSFHGLQVIKCSWNQMCNSVVMQKSVERDKTTK